MAIDVRRASGAEFDHWDEHVDRSPQGLVFHRRGFLEVLERHSPGTLHPLIGYQGEEPIGLFPVFELAKGPISTTFSPPPRRAIPYLGPVLLNDQQLRQRKYEMRNEEFVEGCLAYLDEVIKPRYTFVETSFEYEDVRPFSLNGFSVDQRYTFIVDLTKGPEGLIGDFSRSTRRTLTSEPDVSFQVGQESVEAIQFVLDQLEARYDAQGKRFGVPAAYVVELYEELGPDRVRPYIGMVGGEWASGIVTVESDDVIYYFIGGGKPDVNFPINEHLHWTIMQEAHERRLCRYDLIGANQRNLADYKAKFDPELVSWFQLERGTTLMNLAAQLYKRLR